LGTLGLESRDERLELPADALREALLNAIAHRDYRSTANVQVYIYHDRLEIITPGGLPAGMKEEDLGLRSMPRNPLLFSLFYRMNLVEQIGSSIKRIRELCVDYGVADPRFEVSANWVAVVFPRAIEGRKQPESRPESMKIKVLTLLADAPMSKSELSAKLGKKRFPDSLTGLSGCSWRIRSSNI